MSDNRFETLAAAETVEVCFHDAGHILGSAWLEVTVGGKKLRVLDMMGNALEQFSAPGKITLPLLNDIQAAGLTPEQLRLLANRHFGVGCDQILLVEAASQPGVDFRYRIFNNSGDEVEHCGNGARCFVRYVRDKEKRERGRADQPNLPLEGFADAEDEQIRDDKIEEGVRANGSEDARGGPPRARAARPRSRCGGGRGRTKW